MYVNLVKVIMSPRLTSSVSRGAVNEMKIASRDSASGTHVQRDWIKLKGAVLVREMEIASREIAIRVSHHWIGFANSAKGKIPRADHRQST